MSSSIRARPLKPTSRPNQYFELGVKGRKTGWVQKRSIKKDEDGLDNVEDFFRSDTEDETDHEQQELAYEDNGFVENGGNFFPGDEDYNNENEPGVIEEEEEENEIEQDRVPRSTSQRQLANTSPFVSRPKVARTPVKALQNQSQGSVRMKRSSSQPRQRLEYHEEEYVSDDDQQDQHLLHKDEAEIEEEYEMRRPASRSTTPVRRTQKLQDAFEEEPLQKSISRSSSSRRASVAPHGLREPSRLSVSRQSPQRVPVRQSPSIRPQNDLSIRYDDAYNSYDPEAPYESNEIDRSPIRSPVRSQRAPRRSVLDDRDYDEPELYQRSRSESVNRSSSKARGRVQSYEPSPSRRYFESSLNDRSYGSASRENNGRRSSLAVRRDDQGFEAPEPYRRREDPIPRPLSRSSSYTPRPGPQNLIASRSTPRSASRSRYDQPTPRSLPRNQYPEPSLSAQDDYDSGPEAFQEYYEEEPQYERENSRLSVASARQDAVNYEDDVDPVRRRRSYEVRKEEIDTPHGVRQTVVERTEESHYENDDYQNDVPRMIVEKTVKRTVSRPKRQKVSGGRRNHRIESMPREEYHDEEDHSIRRSRRNRIAPVKYWENERVQYGRRESTGGPVPLTIVSVARSEHRESDEHLQRRKAKRSRPAVAQAIGDVPCYDWDTNELEERRLFVTPSMLNLQENDLGYKWQKTLGEKSFLASGILSFPKGTKKPLKTSHDSAIIFFVFAGVVKITINETSVTVGTGTHFLVPRGNHYAIENVGHQDARVFFCHGKEILVQEDEGPAQ